MSNIQKVKNKKGFKSVGTFFFGMFIGLLLTLLTIFLLCLWAYKNLSIRKIEKITNNEININDEIKSITISDVVKNLNGIVKNIDKYTIGDLENDFEITIIGDKGMIPNTIYGLDLTPLRNSTKDSIKSDLTKIIDNASLSTILNAMSIENENLGLFNDIMNETITYYYDYSIDSKHVYNKDMSDSTKEIVFEVKAVNSDGADYSGNGEIYLKIGSSATKYKVSDGLVVVAFKDIPLKSAFNDFNTVINDLELHKVLEFTKVDGKYYDKNQNEVTGILNILADCKVDELHSRMKTIQLYEILGYTKDGDNYYTDSTKTTKVSNIMNALATATIDTVDEKINSLLATDLFEKENTPILKLFTDEQLSTLKIFDLPNAIVDRINGTNGFTSATIGDLINAGIISPEKEINDAVKSMTIVQLIEFADTYSSLITG